MGVSLFTGRIEVFLLISVAGVRLLSLWNVFVVFNRTEYHRHTPKAVKNFLSSLTRVHVQPT